MRKTFKLFCAAAMAALAVSSCYDDSFLRGEIDRLDGRVDSLASVLNKDVANLAALQSSVTTLETSLKQAIADGDAAVKKALEDALAAAQADLKKVKSDLAQALAVGAQNVEDLDKLQAQLEGTVKTLTDAINMVYSDLSERVDFLTSDVETLEAALKALEATVGTNYKDLLKKLDEVDGVVDGHIADMKTALEDLAAADEKFNKDLAAAIAKIVVSKVEEVDGKIVLTLADGKTVELSKPLSNVDNNGLVTIVEKDGVKYWSVVGAETHTGVPVGHPDYKLDFQINGTTNELEYRVNDGEWISTGVKVEATAENVKVITGFENATDYVKITIAGSEVVLPKYVAEAVSVELSRTSMFVGFGTSKDVTITAEGVSEAYVMSKPDGWKATINGNTLTAYAPLASAAEVGAYEKEGEILIHLTTNSGKCHIAKLNVQTGKRFNIEIDSSTGVVTLFNAIVDAEEDYYGTIYSFGNAGIGLVSVEEFEEFESFEEFIKEASNENVETLTSTRLGNIRYRTRPGSEEMVFDGVADYNAGTHEEETLTTTMADLWSVAYPSYTLTEGAQYVVFAIPEEGTKMLIDEAVYCYYEPTHINVTSQSTSWNDITFSFELNGADEYFAGYAPAAQLALQDMTIYDYLQSQMMYFEYLGYEGIEYFAQIPVTDGCSLSLGKDFYCPSILPGNEYHIFVFPYKEGMTFENFDFERDFKPYVFTFKTSDITEDNELTKPVVTPVVDYYNVSANVTIEDNISAVYYDYLEDIDINDDDLDEKIFEDVLKTTYPALTESGSTMKKSTSPGTEFVLATVTISNDGTYRLDKTPISSVEEPSISETIKITDITCTKNDDGSHTVTAIVTGDATTLATYYIGNADSASYVKSDILKNSTRYTNWVEISGNSATYTFTKNDSKTYFYLCAFKRNDNGSVEWSDVVIKSFAEFDTPAE